MAIPLRQTASAPPSVRTVRQTRPASRLVEVPARRRVARFAIALTVLLGGVMMGAIYLHTRIAERQLEIDRLESAVRESQTDFDILRAERADLRSLTRLSRIALGLGMQPAEESQFVNVDPMVLAVTIARTGEVPTDSEIVAGSMAQLGPLDQFRLVKAVAAEAP